MSGLPTNLDDLISSRSVEGHRLEFKATWDDRIKASTTRTICAFANDLLNLNGGYVVLGIEINESGHPVFPPRGLDDLNLDDVQKEIRGQCQRIDPVYQPVLFPEVYQNRAILVIWAPGGDNRPYQAPRTLNSAERSFFVRQGSETVEARHDILRQLLERTAKVPFDDRRNPEAKAEDISISLVRRFLADVRSDLARSEGKISDAEILRLMRLVSPVNGHELPRNAALLFFNESPEKFFMGARIEIVQFADGAGGDLIEERTIKGPVQEQIKLTLDVLDSLSDVQLRKQSGRAEVDRMVAYPYEAMEEAVVNAVYHRSYEGSTEPTKIYLFPDRMEIISYPGPVSGLELVHFQSGTTVPPVPARNRRIGEFLKELRLAEGRGTGLPKIRRKMMENGSPDPQFEFDAGRSYFKATLPVHPRYQIVHALRESAQLWALGDRAGATAHLLRVLQQQPGSGAVVSQLIEHAAAVDNLELARKTFEQFQTEKSKTEVAQPYLVFAKILLDRNRASEARKVLAMIPSPGSATELVETAILRKRAGDFESAHRLFLQAFSEMKDDAKTVHEFAQTKLAITKGMDIRRHRPARKRMTREAIELLHRAIQLTSDPVREAWCWFEMAKALAWLREPATQVEAAFLKAISIRPNEQSFQEGYQRWKEREAKINLEKSPE